VRIKHPDLPQELREAAGEAIGALWQRAQALATDHLAAVRSEALASLATATLQVEAAQARAETAEAANSDQQAEVVRKRL